MNWSEAIKAMSEGKKVRAHHWINDHYISSTESTSVSEYLWRQFFGFTWVLYEEPAPKKPEISEYDKLKYGMYAEVLQTISEQFKEFSK